jgi:hypothetical protein
LALTTRGRECCGYLSGVADTIPEAMQKAFEKVFQPLEHLEARHRQLARNGPEAGSRAARDGRTKLGRMAWDLGLAASVIGVDHLVGWRMLRLRGGFQPTVAHWTLIRGAIEGMSVARWLCDRSIDANERIRRAAGVQLDDYRQRLAFERRMDGRLVKPKGRGRTAAQRIAAFEHRLGQTKSIPMPSATDLFARYALPDDEKLLAGEGLFRVISAIAHAKVWSLPALTTATERIQHAGGRLTMGLTTDDKRVLDVTQVTMRVAADALADLEWYGSDEEMIP